MRHERRIKRAIETLRRTEGGNFSAKRVMTELGLHQKDIHVRTVQKHLRRMGYGFLQARKKGILTTKDIKRRLTFANM